MRSWLASGEQVLVETSPHARSLTGPVLVGLLVVAATGLLLSWLQPDPFGRMLPQGLAFREPALFLVLAAAFLVEICYPVRRYVSWAGTKYQLTSRRVVVRRGFVLHRRVDFPLGAIRSISMNQSILQRIARTGTLALDMGTDGAASIANVPEVNRFRNYILEAIEELPHSALAQPPIMGENAAGTDSYRWEGGTNG